jgi:hypothetical protein
MEPEPYSGGSFWRFGSVHQNGSILANMRVEALLLALLFGVAPFIAALGTDAGATANSLEV